MLRELLAVFGLDFDSDNADLAFGSIEGLTDALGGLRSTLLDNALVSGISEFVSQMSEVGDAVLQVSRQIDQSTDQVQEYGFLFSQVGLDIDEVGDVITTLQERARDANDSADIRSMFESISVSTRDASGELLDANELFRQTVQGLSEMENSTDRAGLALTLFGDNGRRLLPILEQGAVAIDEASEEFKRLGGGLSGEAVLATVEYTRAMAELEVVQESLRGQIVEFLFPAITEIIRISTETINVFREWTDDSYILETAFGILTAAAVAFGISVLISFGPAIATALLAAAAFAALVLIVEDLVVGIKGGQSVFGEFLDEITGTEDVLPRVGSAFNNWIDDLSDSMGDLGGTWDELVDGLEYAWVELIGGFEGLWDGFVDLVLRGVGSLAESLSSLAGAVGLDSLGEGLARDARQLQRMRGTVADTTPPAGATTPNPGGRGDINVDSRPQFTQTVVIQQASDIDAVRREIDGANGRMSRRMARELADQVSRRRG